MIVRPEQLAGLLYGEGRLSEASQLLEEGLRFDPEQADFRLLLAGLIVLALALVMREAKLLADEQQLTV